MVFCVLGICTFSKLVQPLNVLSPISITLSGMEASVKDVQFWKT